MEQIKKRLTFNKEVLKAVLGMLDIEEGEEIDYEYLIKQFNLLSEQFTEDIDHTLKYLEKHKQSQNKIQQSIYL